jgi:hypothetical protein
MTSPGSTVPSAEAENDLLSVELAPRRLVQHDQLKDGGYELPDNLNKAKPASSRYETYEGAREVYRPRA